MIDELRRLSVIANAFEAEGNARAGAEVTLAMQKIAGKLEDEEEEGKCSGCGKVRRDLKGGKCERCRKGQRRPPRFDGRNSAGR